MDIKLLISLLFFCISTSITPGPNNLMIMFSGLNYGVKKSLPHYYGICLGFGFMLLIVGLGFSSFFAAYPSLSGIIKTLGLLYMFYLSYKIITSTTKISMSKTARPLSFMQAVLFQWVNPKTWMMATGVFAAFSLPHINIYQQTLRITGIFAFTAAPCIALWMLGGGMLQSLLKNKKELNYFNYLMGALLILSIIGLV